MCAHHDCGRTALVGRSLRAGADLDGGWLALVGGASAALNCARRDGWLGWSPTRQGHRGGVIANNRRVLIRPGGRVKNRAARILGRPLARRSADGQAAQGHRLLRAETFIDPDRATQFRDQPAARAPRLQPHGRVAGLPGRRRRTRSSGGSACRPSSPVPTRRPPRDSAALESLVCPTPFAPSAPRHTPHQAPPTTHTASRAPTSDGQTPVLDIPRRRR